MATVHYAAPPPPPPNAHALSRPRADAAADDGSDSESVAESSCPGPCSRQSASSGFLGRDEDDDDGCSSCVEGNELGGGYHYQEADDGDDDEVSTATVWWKKRLAAGDSCAFQPSVAREEAEDPERVAARQAEDRKFWEDCLGTGYP